MAGKRNPKRWDRGLAKLRPVKGLFFEESERAARDVRSCADCDARCCKVGFNSMKVSRIEAEVLGRRLREPDLAPLLPEILQRASDEAARLREDPEATYDCPLLSPEGLCRVHGPAQPAGCLSFRPVPDGGCDHDFDFFRRHEERIRDAERAAFRKASAPLPIPIALSRVLGRPDPE